MAKNKGKSNSVSKSRGDKGHAAAAKPARNDEMEHELFAPWSKGGKGGKSGKSGKGGKGSAAKRKVLSCSIDSVFFCHIRRSL